MTAVLLLILAAVAVTLLVVSAVQLLYLESMRLRAKETPALEYFKETLEDRFGLKGEAGAFAFSLLKHVLLMALPLLLFVLLHPAPARNEPAFWRSLAEAMGMSCVAMVGLSHILPQLLNRRTSGRWMAPAAPLLRALLLTTKPVLAVLEFLRSLADLGSPEEQRVEANVQVENIDALISAGAEEGLIEEQDRKLIQSVVAFGDKRVRQVMTPRPNIVAISETATLEEFRQLVAREQYSRVPVYGSDIDDITGFVHVRDLVEVDPALRPGRTVGELKRPIDVVPETKPVDALMREMQEKGSQMVVVVDEYGQTAGLATMEDLVEEIVGEISDEHDPDRDIARQADGSFVVSGNFDLDHLAELVQFRPHEATESTTVGGLVTEWLGHVPNPGESVERGGLRLEVLSSDQRRVSQVRISRAPGEAEANGR